MTDIDFYSSFLNFRAQCFAEEIQNLLGFYGLLLLTHWQERGSFGRLCRQHAEFYPEVDYGAVVKLGSRNLSGEPFFCKKERNNVIYILRFLIKKKIPFVRMGVYDDQLQNIYFLLQLGNCREYLLLIIRVSTFEQLLHGMQSL